MTVFLRALQDVVHLVQRYAFCCLTYRIYKAFDGIVLSCLWDGGSGFLLSLSKWSFTIILMANNCK